MPGPHRDLPDRLARLFGLLSEVVRTPSGLRAFEAMLRYLGSSKRVRSEDVTRAVQEAFPQEGEKLMESMVEQLIQEGMEKGVEKGMEQGFEKGAVDTARKLLLEVLEARLGSLPAGIVKQIQGMEDLRALTALHRQAATAESLELFREALSRTLKR